MTAACMKKAYGLITGHAYTILGVVKLEEGGKTVAHLVKLRNPWGKEKYTGDWHDDDSKWTDDLKKQAKLVSADDGIFHMPFKNFRHAFTAYEVLYY